jgi:hypothetical protein
VSRHYDVVVVGGNTAAVVAAALLAKRGMRGLLIDQGELASTDANLLPDLVLSDEASPVMRHVHSELGVADQVSKRTRVDRPLLQAIYPDQRFDLFVDPIERQREVERVFGSKCNAALAITTTQITNGEAEAGLFLEEAGELPATGFFGRRASASAQRKHESLGRTMSVGAATDDLPVELTEIFVAMLPFLGYFDARSPTDVTMARFSRLTARFMRGLFGLPDRRPLRELFLSVAEQRAFEVMRTAVESIDPSGKVVNLTAAGQRDPITADAVIDASWDLSGLDTIPHKRQKKDLALTLQNAKPRGFLHALGIEVDAAVLPPGMAEHLLLLNGRRDPDRVDAEDPDSADRAIWISQRPGHASERVQLVAAQAVSSVRAHAQGTDELEEVMRARIERLAPFLMDGAPEFSSLSGRGATKSERSLLTHPLYDPELDPVLGLTGISMRTPYKQLFCAGPAVLPGLGAEGAYLSALQAADAAETLLKKTKRPKTLGARLKAG